MKLNITKQIRKEMEEMIYTTFDLLDKTKANGDRYRELFQKMTDAQFTKFFEEFFADPDQFLILEVIDYERDVRMEDIEKAAEFLEVPLFERVIMPHINMDLDEPVLTKYEVPVGYAPTKRMQQMVVKKNTTSTEASSRSALTNQVVGKDKNARDSDTENFALTTLDMTQNLRELNGPRADDMVMKNEMYSAIAKNGFVSLDTLTDDVGNKTTLNAVDVQLIGMGLKSDLVTKGLEVRRTLKK